MKKNRGDRWASLKKREKKWGRKDFTFQFVYNSVTHDLQKGDLYGRNQILVSIRSFILNGGRTTDSPFPSNRHSFFKNDLLGRGVRKWLLVFRYLV